MRGRHDGSYGLPRWLFFRILHSLASCQLSLVVILRNLVQPQILLALPEQYQKWSEVEWSEEKSDIQSQAKYDMMIYDI